MPYISEAERKRAEHLARLGQRWMPLAEAVSQIRTAENCDQKEAWRQLRNAIIDEKVSVRWADAVCPPAVRVREWISAFFP
jgi:hypothetical protein